MNIPDIQYLLPALFAGLGVALLAGPLGVVMIWRRMANFGDALSHAGLLGITLALAWHINLMLGVIIIALAVAYLLLVIQKRLPVAQDTALGMLSHTALAAGLLLLAANQEVRVDILGFLYGDILAVTWQEVGLIYGGGGLVLGILIGIWPGLLRIAIDPELAQVEGVAVRRIETVYMCLLAIVVAIAIKIVGVLLITALLLIPGAMARLFSRTPEQMAGAASLIGAVSVSIGLLCSHGWDVPTGPAIVVSAAGMLAITAIIKFIR